MFKYNIYIDDSYIVCEHADCIPIKLRELEFPNPLHVGEGLIVQGFNLGYVREVEHSYKGGRFQTIVGVSPEGNIPNDLAVIVKKLAKGEPLPGLDGLIENRDEWFEAYQENKSEANLE